VKADRLEHNAEVCEQSERTEALCEKQLSVLSLYGGKKSSA
jgi:hypothetical protein